LPRLTEEEKKLGILLEMLPFALDATAALKESKVLRAGIVPGSDVVYGSAKLWAW
jgi:hypothetical protein